MRGRGSRGDSSTFDWRGFVAFDIAATLVSDSESYEVIDAVERLGTELIGAFRPILYGMTSIWSHWSVHELQDFIGEGLGFFEAVVLSFVTRP